MPRRHQNSAAVIDASCLNNLWHLELVQLLAQKYSRVYIPSHVQEEAGRKHRRRHKLHDLLRQYAFLQRCAVGNPFEAQLLYDRRNNPTAPLDRGEAETIIQARERGITQVLIDERKGRKFAILHSLEPIGTLGLLKEFKRNGLIPEVRPLIERLRKELHYRIRDEVLRQELNDEY